MVLRSNILNIESWTSMTNQHRSAEVTIPFIGVSSDRNWLWLVNIVIGIFILYLLRDSLMKSRKDA